MKALAATFGCIVLCTLAPDFAKAQDASGTGSLQGNAWQKYRPVQRPYGQYPSPALIPPGQTPDENPDTTSTNPYFSIAPNLLRDGYLRVTTNTELLRMAVYDVQGKELLVFREGFAKDFFIQLPALNAGMYLIRAEAPGQKFTEKLVVVR